MLNHQRGLDCSDLNRVIAPEIKADVFYEIIKRLAAPQSLDAVPRASERATRAMPTSSQSATCAVSRQTSE
jgi:hypothetical protein